MTPANKNPTHPSPTLPDLVGVVSDSFNRGLAPWEKQNGLLFSVETSPV